MNNRFPSSIPSFEEATFSNVQEILDETHLINGKNYN
jgi:hypothetical protein